MRTKLFLLFVILAAAGGFYAGWWYRGRSEPTFEERTNEAAEHMRDAVRSLTR